MTPNKITLKWLKFIICEVWPNNFDWIVKVYFKEKHNLTEIINFFLICSNFKKNYVTNFVQSQFWWIVDAVSIVLDTSFNKVLSWSFMGLIGPEFYCFGIRIQKIVFHCLYRSKTNYTRLNSSNIKRTTRAKLLSFVIYMEAIIYLLW